MRHQRIILKIKILILFILSFSVLQAKDFTNLKILSTTDIHGNILNYDYYQDKIDNSIGLNRLSSIVKEYRKDIKNNVILVDNGDLIQGSPFADYAITLDLSKNKHAILKAMEHMKYDVINIGNHEFNYGLDKLDEIIKQSKIPFVNANVYDAATKKPRFTQYIILDRELVSQEGKKSKIKIAIIGITPPQIMLWDKTKLTDKVMVNDVISEVSKLTKYLKSEQKVDLIGILSHSGITEAPYKNKMENTVVELTKNKSIDFIVAGHDHGEFPKEDLPSYPNTKLINNQNGTIRNIPVVMASSWGKYLGVIDMILESNNNKWQVLSGKSYLVEGKIEDKELNKLVNIEHKATLKYLNASVSSESGGESLSTVNKTLSNYFAVIKPDFATNLTNKAVVNYISNVFVKENPKYSNIPVLSATAVFKNGGRGGPSNYTVLNKGSLSLKSINDIYGFNNTIVILKVTGAEVKELLEWASQMYNTINPNDKEPQNLVDDSFRTYNFDVMGDGLTYDIVATKESRYKGVVLVNKNTRRIENLKYNGKLVKDKDIFLLGTSDYRANTNNIINKNGKNTIFDSAVEHRAVLIDYIKSHSSIENIVNDSWNLILGEGTKVNFITSIKAQDILKQDKISDIKLIKDENNGFGVYQYLSKN